MKKILIVDKFNSNNHDFIKNILTFLKAGNNEVFCDIEGLCNEGFAKNINQAENFDLIFSIGGDGTMMGAIRKYIDYQSPIVGINLGRVGFLTDLEKDHVYEGITQIINNEFTEEKRDILSAQVWENDKCLLEEIAVNDIVIGRGVSGKLKQFSVFVDGEYAFNQFADGIIVSTPTGSTAYSLAAGGPILSPKAKVFNVVPVCPQNLSNRPIVISNDSEIKIIASGDKAIYWATDGVEPEPIKEGCFVKIKKHQKSITLAHPKNYSFFHGLRNKLNWNM